MGLVAKSYMRKGFLIYEEMRKYLTIFEYERPEVIHDFATDFFLNFLVNDENSIFFFFSVITKKPLQILYTVQPLQSK